MSEAGTLEILIQIREELAGLQRTQAGLRDAKKEAQGLGAVLRQGLGIGTGMQLAAGAVAVLRNTLRATVVDAFRLAEEIKDQSEALGVTAEAYQVLRYELAQAGVDAGRLTMAMTRQNESLAEARNLGSAAAQAYKDLGLSAADLEGLRPEERLVAVARGVAGAADKTKAFSAASQILGSRGLPQLLNALRNLARDGYDRVAESAREANQVMGGDTVERLDKATKAWERMWNAATIKTGESIGFWEQIAGAAGKDPIGTYSAGLQAPLYWAGLMKNDPVGQLFNKNAAPPKPAGPALPTGPAMATRESHVVVELARQEAEAARLRKSALGTEGDKRRELLPIIEQQIRLQEELISLRFGEGGTTPFETVDGEERVTERSLELYRARNELEAKLGELRQQRLETVDRPLAALGRELADTTAVTTDILKNSLAQGISSLSGSIWSVATGTGKWRDAFRNLGQVAGQALTELIVKLLIIRPLLSIFGIDGGPKGAVKAGEIMHYGSAAGGGTFVTHGPTRLTVGDNPGGMELVSVLPLSGVGRTTVNGRAAAMAGGGALLAGARSLMGGGDTFHFNYAFNGGVSREEVLGLLPTIVEASKGAVLEAQRRRRDGFR